MGDSWNGWQGGPPRSRYQNPYSPYQQMGPRFQFYNGNNGMPHERMHYPSMMHSGPPPFNGSKRHHYNHQQSFRDSFAPDRPPPPREPPPEMPPPPSDDGLHVQSQTHNMTVAVVPQHMLPMPMISSAFSPNSWAPRFRNPAPRWNNKNQKKSQKRPAGITPEVVPQKRTMRTKNMNIVWNKEDADKALAAESEQCQSDVETLVIRFPEREITSESIMEHLPNAMHVHFQIPGSPRYCFVKVRPGLDVDEFIAQANDTDWYGMGKLSCTRKERKKANNVNDIVDPYVLYLGNLPLNIATSAVKEKFPTSIRVDVGYAQKMKMTRYAFIRFSTVEDSIEALKEAANLKFDHRTPVVRFRRLQKNHNLLAEIPVEVKTSKKQRKAKIKALDDQAKQDAVMKEASACVKPEKGEGSSAITTSSGALAVAEFSLAELEAKETSTYDEKYPLFDDEDEEEEEEVNTRLIPFRAATPSSSDDEEESIDVNEVPHEADYSGLLSGIKPEESKVKPEI